MTQTTSKGSGMDQAMFSGAVIAFLLAVFVVFSLHAFYGGGGPGKGEISLRLGTPPDLSAPVNLDTGR